MGLCLSAVFVPIERRINGLRQQIASTTAVRQQAVRQPL
jgi:hypothetical protein